MAHPKVRTLDPRSDWNFFHELQPLAPEDRTQIRPLEEESAQLLWTELVSTQPRERHPMLLPPGHWIGNVLEWGPLWERSWPASAPDAVARFLRSRIDWAEETETYFVWMREQAVRVPWGVFLRTWRAFLFNDEGPFLVRRDSPEFVVFSPRGPVGVGHRVRLEPGDAGHHSV